MELLLIALIGGLAGFLGVSFIFKKTCLGCNERTLPLFGASVCDNCRDRIGEDGMKNLEWKDGVPYIPTPPSICFACQKRDDANASFCSRIQESDDAYPQRCVHADAAHSCEILSKERKKVNWFYIPVFQTLTLENTPIPQGIERIRLVIPQDIVSEKTYLGKKVMSPSLKTAHRARGFSDGIIIIEDQREKTVVLRNSDEELLQTLKNSDGEESYLILEREDQFQEGSGGGAGSRRSWEEETFTPAERVETVVVEEESKKTSYVCEEAKVSYVTIDSYESNSGGGGGGCNNE